MSRVKTIVQSIEDRRKKALEYLKKCVLDQDLINELKKATGEEKEMFPVVVNPNGIIESGANRLASDSNWKIVPTNNDDETALINRLKYEQNTKSPLKHAESMKRTIEELVNLYRTEKKSEFSEWFKTHVKRKLKSDYFNPSKEWTEVKMPKIEEFLAEKTGYSERTIREYLPESMKQKHTTKEGYIKTKSEAPSDLPKEPEKTVEQPSEKPKPEDKPDQQPKPVEHIPVVPSIFKCPKCGSEYDTKTWKPIEKSKSPDCQHSHVEFMTGVGMVCQDCNQILHP